MLFFLPPTQAIGGPLSHNNKNSMRIFVVVFSGSNKYGFKNWKTFFTVFVFFTVFCLNYNNYLLIIMLMFF